MHQDLLLKDLLGVKVTQFPITSFSNYVLLCCIANMLFILYVTQIHVAEELSNSILENEGTQSNTLHSDGTSRWRYLHDCNKADATFVARFSRYAGGRDAKTQLNTFRETLDDFFNTSCLKKNSNFFPHVFYYSIKKPMSGRCVTHKSLIIYLLNIKLP